MSGDKVYRRESLATLVSVEVVAGFSFIQLPAPRGQARPSRDSVRSPRIWSSKAE